MQRYFKFIERLSRFGDKKLVIWGAGINGIKIKNALASVGRETEYLVDTRADKNCFLPEKLYLEDKERFLVIVSPQFASYIREIDQQLEQWGWKEDINYINFMTRDEIDPEINYFDPFLGYTRIRSMEGFAVRGGKDSSNKIAVLGNCTSVFHTNRKTWVDELADYVTRRGEPSYSIYNGACEGYSSSQELLKLIRDIFPIKPKAILVLNGVIDAINTNSSAEHPYFSRYEVNLLEKQFSKSESHQTPARVLFGNQNPENRWEHYVRNMRIMHAASEAVGIPFLAFLQPSLYDSTEGLTVDEKAMFESIYARESLKKIYETAHDFYEKVKSALAGEEWVYDLTDLFAGRGQMQRGMYLDEIHYTSQGYDLLGKAVLEIATQNLALTGEQAGTE